MSFHGISFSILEDMLDVTFGISTGNDEITCTIEVLVFHGSVVSHFHCPSVFSINGYVADIFGFRKGISKKYVLFIS